MLDRLAGVFKSLEKRRVKYVVIGGIAAVMHGVPRATFDLDILIETSAENGVRLLEALKAAGVGTAEPISSKQLLQNEITIFEDHVRIDVLTSAPGITFERAWKNRETMEFRGQSFNVIGRQDLIASKRASGREEDLEDARLLDLKPKG